MTPPAIKTPVTVERGEELGHTIWVLLDADGEYVCETAEHETADEIARIINDSDRLRAELDEAIRMLGIIALNAKMIPDPAIGCAADIYTVPIDDVDEAARLVARHEGEKG